MDKEPTQPSIILTADEAHQQGRIFDRIVKARNQREMPRDEFDGMTYEQTYLANKRAAMSFLTPKKNDDEVRVNTGTTEKRIELVINELLALNVGTTTKAFDVDDNLLEGISESLTDVVKRTKQIELAKDKNPYFYKELLTQPCVFVEELFLSKRVPDNSKKGFRTRNMCERRMLQGVQVYLGDINMPDVRFNDQPYIVKYCRMFKSEGEPLFKDMNPEKWAGIKAGPYQSPGSPSNELYRKNSLIGDEIEVFYYFSYPDNEVQIYVQGVPWLKVGERYTDVYGELGGYHITQVGLYPYSWDFAYAKPLTQSAKTLQALDNETIRNLIRKFRQAIEPPLGVPRGKVYSRDIWTPGAMTQGVKATDFERLIDHQGVTQSEMAMFDLIEKKTNEFIGTSQAEPLQNKGQVTATELMLAQKNAIKMLGNSVLAVMRLEEKLDMLRIRNVLVNHTKPIGKAIDPVTNQVNDIYQQFSLDGEDVDGLEGRKVVKMMDRSLTEDEQIETFAQEKRGREQGKPMKFSVINVPQLRDLDLYFYVTASAKERESDQVDRAQFSEMLNQAAGVSKMTGLTINKGKIAERFERTWKEKDMFEKDAPAAMAPPMPGAPVPGAPGMALPGMEQGTKMGNEMSAGDLT